MRRRVSRLLSTLLALCMVLALLPGTARAAESDLTDWYFLFAIFTNVDADCDDGNGTTTHTTYTMPREEVDLIRENTKAFERYMNNTGVMRAHVDVVEIDAPVTELGESSYGSLLTVENAAPFLENRVDLDKYDHVICVVSLNVITRYVGMTGALFENGTGQSCVNSINYEEQRQWSTLSEDPDYPCSEGLYIHEFLHFMEHMCRKWGVEFDEHGIQDLYTPQTDGWKSCYTDIILNRVRGDSKTGTGVFPAAWQYPPHVFRTARKLTVPDGAVRVGRDAFYNCSNLESVSIPNSVTGIDVSAFYGCSGLKSISIPSGVTSIGGYAFYNCGSLRSVTIPSGVTNIGYAAFWNAALKDVYYGGTRAQWNAIQIDKFNASLTDAAIHYNSAGMAYPNTVKVELDGKPVEFQMYALKDANGGETNYIKVRDLALAMNGSKAPFNVSYDGKVNLFTKQTYTPIGTENQTPFSGPRSYRLPSDRTYVNGAASDLQAFVLTDDNGGQYTYYQLRDLGGKLGFNVSWTRERGIYIESDKPYVDERQ